MLDKSKDETVSTSDFRRVVSTFVYGLSNDQLDHIIAKVGACDIQDNILLVKCDIFVLIQRQIIKRTAT